MKDKSINYYRVEKAIHYMEANFRNHPDLDKIAEHVNLSPFHFQKLFLDWVGITPKKFLQFLTLDFLKSRIYESKNVIDAANMSGLSSQSRVYDLFVHIEGVSPQEFKSCGQGIQIAYGYHSTPFGMCFIAVADRGICELRFIDENLLRTEFSVFEQKWRYAKIIHDPQSTQKFIQKIFDPEKNQESLQLFVQGSDFQIKVWEALVNIPFGEVCSYESFTAKLGEAKNIRAVAGAAGRNPISYLIPCHRVITKTGDVGNFEKGKTRKKILLAWEMSQMLEAI